MVVVIAGCIGIFHHDHLVVQHHCVAGRAFRTHICRGACHEQVFDAHALQPLVEIGGSGDERAEPLLVNHEIALAEIKVRIKLVSIVTWAELGQMIVPLRIREEIVMVEAPLAGSADFVGQSHHDPDHGHGLFAARRR